MDRVGVLALPFHLLALPFHLLRFPFHVFSRSFRVVPPLSLVRVAARGRSSARRCRRRRRWMAGGALRAGVASTRAEQGNCGSSDRGSHAAPAMRASHLFVIPLASPKDTSDQSVLCVRPHGVPNAFTGGVQRLQRDFPATAGILNIATNLKRSAAMNHFEPTNRHEADPGPSGPSAASERSFSLDRSAWIPAPKHARQRRARRFLAYRRSGRIAAAAAICAAIGLPVAVATSPSATAAQLVTSAASGTGASNARSAPAQAVP